MSGTTEETSENSMNLPAALVGSFGVAVPSYIVIHDFYPQGKLLLPLLVLAVGYFIARGRDLAWVRSWGCMATTALLYSALFLAMSLSLNQLPRKDIGDAFVIPALTAAFVIIGAGFFGLCLLFLFQAVWQYKRVKRRRNHPGPGDEVSGKGIKPGD